MTKQINPSVITTLERVENTKVIQINSNIHETKFPKLISEINAFLGGCFLNGKEDEYTYQVSNVSYQDIHDYIRNTLTKTDTPVQRMLSNCIELEYDETGELWFEMVYARQIGEGEYDYTRIRVENLDEMFGEQMMNEAINAARSIAERLSFPI